MPSSTRPTAADEAMELAEGSRKAWLRFAWRATACHVVTYMLAGLLASTLLDYASWWDTEPLSGMRSLDSPWVAAGPALQVLRGLVLALVLFPFRRRILEQRGWLALWGLLVGLGIVSTYGPAPGSIEGAIYTTMPLPFHVFGAPEVYGQSLAFSACLVGWYQRPHAAWSWVFGALTLLTLIISLGGAAVLYWG